MNQVMITNWIHDTVNILIKYARLRIFSLTHCLWCNVVGDILAFNIFN